MNILDIQQAHKQYRKTIAVNNISLQVPKGTIFGLLGPNGAGKTSLIRMITQITGLDSGKIYFDGELLTTKHTSNIGYMPEERGLYKKMKIGEQLIYLAQLKDMSKATAKEKINEWLERFEITDWWDKKVEDLSKGMQQKVQFISTVMHEPKLLILDEPFSGLDPINANLIRDEIYRLVNEKGISVIFSTHRMEQVEQICENIALINEGKCILEGNVSALKNEYKKNIYQLTTTTKLPEQLLSLYTILQVGNNTVQIQLQEGQNSNKVLQDVINEGVQVQSFQEVLPTMNEIFIEKVQQH